MSSAPCNSRGNPRVHGFDARDIHNRATNGTGVPFLFEVQGTGLSSAHATAASMIDKSFLFHSLKTSIAFRLEPPKNHLNDNIKRIRRVMRESRERQVAKAQTQSKPVKALWRSKQYDYVQSKVKQRLEEVLCDH